jgi:hypothetical protein
MASFVAGKHSTHLSTFHGIADAAIMAQDRTTSSANRIRR